MGPLLFFPPASPNAAAESFQFIMSTSQLLTALLCKCLHSLSRGEENFFLILSRFKQKQTRAQLNWIKKAACARKSDTAPAEAKWNLK